VAVLRINNRQPECSSRVSSDRKLQELFQNRSFWIGSTAIFHTRQVMDYLCGVIESAIERLISGENYLIISGQVEAQV
jgi:hypothetical protein